MCNTATRRDFLPLISIVFHVPHLDPILQINGKLLEWSHYWGWVNLNPEPWTLLCVRMITPLSLADSTPVATELQPHDVALEGSTERIASVQLSHDVALHGSTERVASGRLPCDVAVECGKSGASRSRGRYSPADLTVIPSGCSAADSLPYKV